MNKWDYELPELRAKVANLTAENETLKHDLKELTSSYYGVLNRLRDATSIEPLTPYEEEKWEEHRKRIMEEK